MECRHTYYNVYLKQKTCEYNKKIRRGQSISFYLKLVVQNVCVKCTFK